MNRILVMGLAVLIGAAAFSPAAVRAADIALVIGNSDYRRVPDARSAEIDARDVAAALEDGGYEVALGINLNRREMRRAIGRFARRLGEGGRMVFYFSGHAQRSDGVTYLAPVDQRGNSLVGVMMDGVPLDLVLRLAQRRAGKAVVFIDAAQLDGFPPSSIAEPGLAAIDPGQGVMVVSAAAPGRAIPRRDVRGSRFARQIVRKFLKPGNKVAKAVRGLRGPVWVTGNVRPGFVLVPRGRGPIAGGGATGTPALSSREIEAALRLSRTQRRDIQEILSLLGHDPRGIDGIFGPGTRTAIRLWQRVNNLRETGYMTAEQFALLERQSADSRNAAGRAAERERERAEADDNDYWDSTGGRGTGNGLRSYLNRYSSGLHASEARTALKRLARSGADLAAQRERRIWRQAQRNDFAADYREYLQGYPTGIWLPEAEDRLAELSRPGHADPGPDPAIGENLLGLSRNDRLSIEQRLNYLGFPPGAQDGFFDGGTRRAISGYQRSRGHASTGYLDGPTISGIMRETRDVRSGVIIDGAAVLRELLRALP